MSSEWIHYLMGQATRQVQEVKTTFYGHVSAYDPTRHAVRVLLPQLQDEDGNPMETGWIQLQTLMIGQNWGLQMAPYYAAATNQAPQNGEQCQVNIVQRASGLSVTAAMTFNDTMTPPGAGDNQGLTGNAGAPEDPYGVNRLEPGEVVLRHQSGSFLKFYQNGDVQVYSAANMNLYCQDRVTIDARTGDVDITVEEGNLNANVTLGNANVTAAQGDVNLTATQTDVNVTAGRDVVVSATTEVHVEAPSIVCGNAAAAQELCNLAFMTLFNNHVHSGVTSGASDSGVPTVPAVAGVETTVNTVAS